METVQQNGRFTLFSCKFHSDVYSTLFVAMSDWTQQYNPQNNKEEGIVAWKV